MQNWHHVMYGIKSTLKKHTLVQYFRQFQNSPRLNNSSYSDVAIDFSRCVSGWLLGGHETHSACHASQPNALWRIYLDVAPIHRWDGSDRALFQLSRWIVICSEHYCTEIRVYDLSWSLRGMQQFSILRYNHNSFYIGDTEMLNT